MKKLELAALLMVAALFVSCGICKKRSTSPKQTTHMMESKSLIGVWQQAIAGQPSIGNAYIQKIGNYKVINADNTMYTLFERGESLVIGLYGTYEMTSDSTLTEKIIKHGQNPSMSGSESKLRYKMIDDNTMASQYFNSVINVWMPEIWVRVPLSPSARY